MPLMRRANISEAGGANVLDGAMITRLLTCQLVGFMQRL